MGEHVSQLMSVREFTNLSECQPHHLPSWHIDRSLHLGAVVGSTEAEQLAPWFRRDPPPPKPPTTPADIRSPRTSTKTTVVLFTC